MRRIWAMLIVVANTRRSRDRGAVSGSGAKKTAKAADRRDLT
jgi:hypothetical protein